jgi:hypothetical protein
MIEHLPSEFKAAVIELFRFIASQQAQSSAPEGQSVRRRQVQGSASQGTQAAAATQSASQGTQAAAATQ